MKKRKDSSFSNNFNLLNSQESNEDILWSSSESSDHENISKNKVSGPSTFSSYKRKRKRKRDENKNLSNLRINIVNVSEKNKAARTDKSPIIGNVNKIEKQLVEDQRVDSSPILTCKVSAYDEKRIVKSPVLLLKSQSTIISPTTKKKLFVNKSEDCKVKENFSGVLLESSCYKSDLFNREVIESECKVNNPQRTSSTEYKVKKFDNEALSGNSTPRTKIDLIKRVQSYFDSHFNSDCTSQQSISECDTLTPKSSSKSTDDLEIISPLTQIKSNSPAKEITFGSSSSWETNIHTQKSRKNKYKKDGLAHRLDCLLKKQNANISLWQHEKYLARNSNFVIPKCEHIVFRIQKVHFKYGSYLIEAVDSSDIRHLIFINSCYVISNCNLTPNAVLKLYMPYRIIEFSDHSKLVVNVSKFEFVPIDM